MIRRQKLIRPQKRGAPQRLAVRRWRSVRFSLELRRGTVLPDKIGIVRTSQDISICSVGPTRGLQSADLRQFRISAGFAFDRGAMDYE